jgi:hypothetical protein
VTGSWQTHTPAAAAAAVARPFSGNLSSKYSALKQRVHLLFNTGSDGSYANLYKVWLPLHAECHLLAAAAGLTTIPLAA